MFANESELVRVFADSLAKSGLQLTPSKRTAGFIVACELPLRGSGISGSMGSADLLVVTEDRRWWLIEAKLRRNPESDPAYLFGNQLARYAAAIECEGLSNLHPYLQSYFFGRKASLQPPATLRSTLAAAADLKGALTAWSASRGSPRPEDEADELVGALAAQIKGRTLTLALLTDSALESQRGGSMTSDVRGLSLY